MLNGDECELIVTEPREPSEERMQKVLMKLAQKIVPEEDNSLQLYAIIGLILGVVALLILVYVCIKSCTAPKAQDRISNVIPQDDG